MDNTNNMKHGDLSVQQISNIQKHLLVALRKRDTFWDKFCSHTSVENGYDALEWRKLDIKELQPSQVSNLTEGVTPTGLKFEYKKYTVKPVNYGSWIGYTDESKRYNFDDVVRDAKLVLGQRAFEEAEIRKATEFLRGTTTMTLATSGTDYFLKDLLKARTILKKNHAKPISGSKYGCILTPEQAAQILVDYKQSITHTSEKEALINGYIGELGGFILFENADPIMYRAKNASAVAGVYKFDLSGTFAAGDTIKIDGVTTTLAAGEDTAAEAAAAVVDDAASFTNYTPTSSGATLILTEKTNKEGAGVPQIVFSSKASKAKMQDYATGKSVRGVAGGGSYGVGMCLFIGKTDYGMPVQTVSFGNSSIEMYNNELGKAVSVDSSGAVVADTLHQHGSVGYKVMGFAARILAEEAIIRAEYILTADAWEQEAYDNMVDDLNGGTARRDFRVA